MPTQIVSPTYGSFKHAHSAATTTKNFYLISSKVVMAMNTALISTDNIFVKRGVIQAPKATGQAWVPMALLYWDDTAKNFTTTSTSNTLAGRVHEAAASGDTEGFVDLDPAA